jgi:hypothetical protein
MGASKIKALVPLFDLKFLRRDRDINCRNFKSAALACETAALPVSDAVMWVPWAFAFMVQADACRFKQR